MLIFIIKVLLFSEKKNISNMNMEIVHCECHLSMTVRLFLKTFFSFCVKLLTLTPLWSVGHKEERSGRLPLSNFFFHYVQMTTSVI